MSNAVASILIMIWAMVLSNRSFAVAMTNLADAEVKRNKLVSCFSNLILQKKIEELPVWNTKKTKLD